jgi:drug/metabolite transporter (DMT)-like permease
MHRIPAPWLMVGAAFGFALMAVFVKLASAHYNAGEIVFYRSLVGLVLMAGVLRWQGHALATPVPGMHFWRCLSGTAALCLWFYAIGNLPLGTAMTLNFMSSVWIALFLIGGAVLAMPLRGAAGTARPAPAGPDGRLVLTVIAGFAGVALVLRPTIAEDQLWHGLCGLLSGMLSALAYLQVTALGRVGEPESRVVLYFSIGGMVAGAAVALLLGGPGGHSPTGALLLLGVGALATVSQWMMTRAYGTGTTLGIASLQYLGIVFSSVFGLLWFDDALPPMALAGMALIIGAGIVATRLRQRTQPRTDPAAPAEG